MSDAAVTEKEGRQSSAGRQTAEHYKGHYICEAEGGFAVYKDKSLEEILWDARAGLNTIDEAKEAIDQYIEDKAAEATEAEAEAKAEAAAKKKLAEIEKVIEKNLKAWKLVSEALYTVRVEKLWRLNPDYKNFSDYCEKRWKIDRQYASRLIMALQTEKHLAEIAGHPVLHNERQGRQYNNMNDAKRKVVEDMVVKDVEMPEALRIANLSDTDRQRVVKEIDGGIGAREALKTIKTVLPVIEQKRKAIEKSLKTAKDELSSFHPTKPEESERIMDLAQSVSDWRADTSSPIALTESKMSPRAWHVSCKWLRCAKSHR